jgi:hypothetical protein
LFQKHALDLIEMLQVTLTRLEQTQELSPDDPALLELKQSLVRIIAELEIIRLGQEKNAA